MFRPERFLDAAGALKKDDHFDFHSFRVTTGKMELYSALSGSLMRQAQIIRLPIFQGDYWEDGTVFRPERFLDAAGALKKDDHLITILTGRLLGRWNSVPPRAVP